MSDKQIIIHLNKILGNELVAINQYFLHAKTLEHWGFNKLASLTKAESIDEMKHADILSARILELGGLPNFQDLGKLMIGQTVHEMLQCDLKLEERALLDLREAIRYVESVSDFGTRDILTRILIAEEEHADFLGRQLELFNQVGEQNYLQSQMG